MERLTAKTWEHVKSVFGRALSVSIPRRALWLDDLSSISGATRGEVLNLLANAEQGEIFEFSLLSPAKAEESDQSQLAAGDCLLDRFEIQRLLGRGGMGEVYAAWDREIGGPVAVKIVGALFANRVEFRKQVRHEIQIARRIQHPNVCRVFDIHRAERPGNPPLTFLTMELLDGCSLHERLTAGPFTTTEAARLAADVAAGIDAIHAAGIVHRDLKSGNIMLAERPARAVILDFGLSRDLERNLLDSLSMFASKAVVGTPAFMAPEQLRGEAATSRSDIYALGVILFHALTGRLPFEGQTPLAIALRRLSEDAPRLRTAAPGIDIRWDRAIASCLEYSPDHRPPSGSSVIEIIEGRSGGTARMPRRPIAVGAAATLVLATFGLITANRPHVPPAAAQVRFQKAQEFAHRRTNENITAAISEYQGAVTLDPGFAAAWAGLAEAYAAAANFMYLEPREARSKALDSATRALSLDSRVPLAHGVLASIRSIDFERWREADALFRRAISAHSGDPRIHDAYSGYLGRIGRHEESIREARAAIALDPASLNSNMRLATELFRAGRMGEYLVQAREVVRMQPLEQVGHLTLARALEWNRDFAAADRELAKARLYGPSEIVEPYQVTLLSAQDRPAEATGIAARVRKEWEETLVPVRIEANQLAGMYGSLGLGDEVAAVLETGYVRGDTTVLAAFTNPYLRTVKQHPGVQSFLKRLGY
ncbi:MAG: protein kinase [Acidobacteriia bacterium]|nr:protein kinase [Terriglobia bacterium]